MTPVVPPALAALAARVPLAETTLAVAGRALRLVHPSNAEALISEEDFARDERLPYWADIWPSSLVLAARLLEAPPPGRTLLELGCGAGVVAVAAAMAGFAVTATDYYDDALAVTAHNVARHGLDAATRLVDWRAWPADLGRFDVVAAADVLYERPYGLLVAAAIDAALADDGVALVADQGRVGAEPFVEACAARGLRVTGVRADAPDGVSVALRLTVYEVRR